MESILSLDELHIGFTDSTKEDYYSEEACDLSREHVGHGSTRYRGKDTDKQTKSKFEDVLIEADYVVANNDRECYPEKLPNICPTTPRTRLKNGMRKKGRAREFSCIDVDDFTVWRKPEMHNENRRIEEREKWSVNKKTDHLPSTATNGCHGGQNWKTFPAVELENSLDSSNSCNSRTSLKINLARGIQTHSLEQNRFFTASPRNIFSPRQLLGSSAEQRGRDKEWTGLPLDLPEKVTKFIEMEISLIKGKEKANSMQKRRSSSLPAYCISEDTELFGPKSMESRKSQDSPLLDKRGSREKTGCYNKGNLDSGNSRM